MRFPWDKNNIKKEEYDKNMSSGRKKYRNTKYK